MWGRFEGKKKRGRFAVAVLFLSVVTVELFSQVLPESILSAIEQQAEIGGGDIEVLIDYYQQLLIRPLEINSATVEELERLALLSPFQIVSLLEYRKEYGKILSASELSLVDGFNSRIVKELVPFISFSNKLLFPDSRIDKFRHELNLKSEIPFSFYVRYRLEYRDILQVGITLENDMGERFRLQNGYYLTDFTSIHLQVKEREIFKRGGIKLKNLVIGDYSARFGQGLSLWNTFSLSIPSSPSSIVKRGSGLLPYRSTGEFNFLRGIGATFSIDKKWELSLLLSRNQRDAKVNGNYFFSLPETGLHNTPSSLQTRRQLNENLLGGNINYSWDRCRIGVTTVIYKFDKMDARRVSEYNKFQRFEGLWGNFSFDGLMVFRGCRLFWEVASDAGASFAGLAGAIIPFSNNMEGSFLYRKYSKSYIALHSSAYISGNSNSNEEGLLLSLSWKPGYRGVLFLYSDIVYHPWWRYRINSSSTEIKTKVQFDYSLGDLHTLSAVIKYSWRNYNSPHRGGFRVGYRVETASGVMGALRIEFTSKWDKSLSIGSLFFGEIGYKAPSKSWEGVLRATYYNIDDWENRIYCYERDLPHSFPFHSFYKKGVEFYIFFHAKIYKKLNLYLKVAAERFRVQLNLQL